MRSLFHASLQTSFTWVWNTSLALAILIALVLLVTLVFQKVLPPRWRYALWLLVVLRMLLPVAPPSRFSIFNAWEGWSFHSKPQSLATAAEAAAPVIAKTPAPDIAADAAVIERSEAPPGHDASGGSLAWLAEAAFVWLLGAVGYLLAVFLQHRKFSSWIKTQKPVNSVRVASLVDQGRAALGLSRIVPVIESDASRAPSVFGVFRPRILLSKAMLQDLSDQELRLVILHELVHVQRRDVSLNWLLILLQALYWFNPFVWLAMRRLRSERELVCDAEVMRHLAPDERHAYGATLIKMLDSFSTRSIDPSLVPILNHKHEIHRRITMIAQFKPTARLATLASALLLLALSCLTFTTAAEKSLAPPAETPKSDADLAKRKEASQRAIRILEDELARQNEEIRNMEKRMDKLRDELGVSDLEDSGQLRGATDLETFRRLESMRIETQAEFVQMDTLYSSLTNQDLSKIKNAILTVVSDAVLSELLSRQTQTEQELAKLLETFGTDHPEVKRTRKVWETINKQIDERLDGILRGLKAKRDTQKAKLDSLQKVSDEFRKVDIGSIEKYRQRRPYLQAKRDLESLQFMREKLMMRIMQERVEAAVGN